LLTLAKQHLEKAKKYLQKKEYFDVLN
jgi:hypothetical protein